MDEQTRFRTALAALCASAEAGDRQLNQEEVQVFFRDMNLDEQQHQMVYAYLASKKIRVRGVELPDVSAEGISYTEEERMFLKQYRKEMRLVKRQPGQVPGELAARAKEGDRQAKRFLTEQYMERVLSIAENYAHQGLPIQDLVQEGNLGLMIGVDTLGLKEEEISWEKHLEHEIHRAIRTALDEQAGSENTEEQITKKLNRLADSITELTEDMGRQVTPEELSLYLDMPMEEMEDLLRIAGENIELADGNGTKEE